jgi:transcriptional regulator of acetoin/glycerol metabolism
MTDEETQLRRALADANGSPTKAAVLLGISRMTVWRRMKKYGLTVQRVVKRAA